MMWSGPLVERFLLDLKRVCWVLGCAGAAMKGERMRRAQLEQVGARIEGASSDIVGLGMCGIAW